MKVAENVHANIVFYKYKSHKLVFYCDIMKVYKVLCIIIQHSNKMEINFRVGKVFDFAGLSIAYLHFVEMFISALTRVLFWCLFPSLLRNWGNKHQNNTLVSAETVRHSSTYTPVQK